MLSLNHEQDKFRFQLILDICHQHEDKFRSVKSCDQPLSVVSRKYFHTGRPKCPCHRGNSKRAKGGNDFNALRLGGLKFDQLPHKSHGISDRSCWQSQPCQFYSSAPAQSQNSPHLIGENLLNLDNRRQSQKNSSWMGQLKPTLRRGQ
jgi:hypothetical protein